MKRKQPRDYGIDYLVELAEQRELTGEEFAAQVKGTERLRIVQGQVRFALEVDYLEYYVDKRIQPVYLVVIDIRSKQGYWLFLQKHALECLADRPWRHQKAITVRIPLGNRLTDGKRFLADLRGAFRFMTDLYPGAIESAVEAERRRVESIDPRFRVKIEVAEGRRNYVFEPKQEVHFRLQFRAPRDEAEAKFEALLKQGLPVRFGPGELEAEGLPALRNRLGDGATVQVSRRLPATLSVCALDPEGNALGGLYGITGELQAGTGESRYGGDLDGCPLIFGLTLGLLEREERNVARVDLQWVPDRWCGLPISSLPFFEEVAAIADVLAGQGTLQLELAVVGQKLVGSPSPSEAIPFADYMRSFIDLVRKARRVGKALGLSPILGPDLTVEDVRDLEQLDQILFHGEYRMAGGGARFTAKLGVRDLPGLARAVGQQGKGTPMVLASATMPYRILGHEFNLTGFQIEFTSVRCVSNVRRLLDYARRRGDASVTVKWEGTSGSEVVIRRSVES